MHLIWFLVLLVCAAAYPLQRVLPYASTPAGEDLGGLANAPDTPLSLAPTCFSGGDCAEPNGSGERISPMVRGALLNALANRAVAPQAPSTSTTLQVIIPPTPSRTSLPPLPTSTQLPSHTQPDSTVEEHSSIPVTPHTPGEASSLMATATATDDGDGSDSGSDPSIPTPTSTDSSSPSELATILGSVFGALIFIGMVVVFIIWWKRS